MGEKPEMTPRTSQNHLHALSKALVLIAKVFFSTARKSQGGRANPERIQHPIGGGRDQVMGLGFLLQGPSSPTASVILGT